MNNPNQTKASLQKPQITSSIKSPKIIAHHTKSTPSSTAVNNKNNVHIASSHVMTTFSSSKPHLINNIIATAAVPVPAITDSLSTNSNDTFTTSINNQDGQYTHPYQTQTIITSTNTTNRNFASITDNCITP